MVDKKSDDEHSRTINDGFDARLRAREQRADVETWLETQRGRPQFRAAPHASRAVSRILKPITDHHGAGQSSLQVNWEIIVGARLARISKPLRYAGGKDGRTLVISAPGAAGALIMASSSEIISKVNSVLGPDYVRHIKVVQGRMTPARTQTSRPRGLTPSETSELQAGLAKVESPSLRAALEVLGQNVLSRQERP